MEESLNTGRCNCLFAGYSLCCYYVEKFRFALFFFLTIYILNILNGGEKFQASYQVSVLLVLNFQGKRILNLESDSNAHSNKVKNTLIFNSFVLCQVSKLSGNTIIC